MATTLEHGSDAGSGSTQGTPTETTDEATALPRQGLVSVGGAVLLAVAVGLGYRVLQYAANRSLWLDEVLVLPWFSNVPWRNVLVPHSIGAIAPGFLALEKLVAGLLGTGEMALRLVPFAAGIASVFVFMAVARRLLTPGGAATATVLFSLSPFLIYYTSELKPYSLDVLVALLLTWLAAHLRDAGMTPRRALGWVAAGLGAMYLSVPAAFVLAGATVALAWSYRRRGQRRSFRLTLAVCAAGALLLLPVAVLLLMRRGADQGDYAHRFWSSGFMPFPPRSLGDLGWFSTTLLAFFRDPLSTLNYIQSTTGFYQAGALMVAFLAGALWLRGERRFTAALLLLPFGFALLGSALQLYPFGGQWVTGGRVVLYLVPAAYMLAGEGIARLLAGLPAAMRPLPWLILAAAVVPSVVQIVVAMPTGRNEIRAMLRYYVQHRQPGDLLYVHYDAKLPLAYYAPRMGVQPGEYVLGPCARLDPMKYVAALGAYRGRPRVWLLFMDGSGAHGFKEESLMLDYLDSVGRRLDDQSATGTALFLYDLRSPPPGGRPFTVNIPPFPPNVEHGCALWQ